MNDDAALFRAVGMTVRRGRRTLLSDVSFSAQKGRILGIVGPNGAGKTTLFEAVTGFLSASEGRVTVHDRDDATSALFYLPDAAHLWGDRRAGWCLEFVAQLFGGTVDKDAVQRLQLAPLSTQRVGSLSKGEGKRLALAAALSTSRPILLLDEPFDGLDFRQTRTAIELLRERAATGRTFILSIHQLSDAARVCDAFLLLDGGRALAAGDLTELRALAGRPEATLEEVFLALE
jgi:ABC-2 type transport system ATP-binding protein